MSDLPQPPDVSIRDTDENTFLALLRALPALMRSTLGDETFAEWWANREWAEQWLRTNYGNAFASEARKAQREAAQL